MLETIHAAFSMCAHTNERKSEKARKEYSCIPRKGRREIQVGVYDEFRFPTCGRMCVTRLFWPHCYESEQFLGLVIV